MKELKTFEFKQPVSERESAYDWDTLLNGKIFELTSGEDFTCKPATFISLARAQAKKRGLKLKTGKTDSGVVIQQVGTVEAAEEETEVAADEEITEELMEEEETQSEPEPIKPAPKGKKGKK